MKTPVIAAMVLLLCQGGVAELPLGEVPPAIRLEGSAGGRVDGTPWASTEIKGKVYALFYVDPDEKDLNEHASQALKKADFPDSLFGSIAVINMAATWMPNFAIQASLKKKQKVYTRTIYVRDKKKALVKAWSLADHTSDVAAFDVQGRVIFSKDGKLSQPAVNALLAAIREQLPRQTDKTDTTKFPPPTGKE